MSKKVSSRLYYFLFLLLACAAFFVGIFASGQKEYSQQALRQHLPDKFIAGQKPISQKIPARLVREGLLITTSLRFPGKELRVGVPKGSSVYDLMEIARETKSFYFTGKDFGPGLGFFVQSIGGIFQDPSVSKYWIYYLNGKKANRGVSNLFLKAGDAIEWRYEAPDL